MKLHKENLLHSLPPYNFPGQEEQDYDSAGYVVVPVPFDSTACYGGNARNGPLAVMQASRQLSFYDWESKSAPIEKGIFCTRELEPVRGDARLTVERVRQACEEIVDDNKKPVLLGGEHLISLGGVQACKPDSVLVLDAHADAWNELEGSKWSHACVSRRMHEEGACVSVAGVRSISEEELDYSKKKGFNVFYANKSTVGDVVKSLKGRVYISVDVDVLDPSVMPSTGTPEPGGLSWEQVCSLLEAIGQKRKVVGFDLVELAPIPFLEAPNYLAAKLLYKMVGWF